MKVRINTLYRFVPVGFDMFVSPVRNVEVHDIVRVINMPACPRANVRGMCYIEHLGGEFIQMVCCNSLIPLTPEEKKVVRKVTTRTAHRIPSTRFNLDIVRDSQTTTQQLRDEATEIVALRELLDRAADTLQDYAAESSDDDYNDPLAMEIRRLLDGKA